jgi:hypothetical protein
VYKGIVSVTDMVLDLTSRHSAEKDLLLHQLGMGMVTCVGISPSTILSIVVDHPHQYALDGYGGLTPP